MTEPTPRRRLPLAPVLWLLAMLAAVVVTVRARYVADLSAFLPEAPTAEQRVLLDQLRNGATARLLLIGIHEPQGAAPSGSNLPGGHDSARTEDAGRELRARLSRELAEAMRASGRFEVVHNGDLGGNRAIGEFLLAHRYLLSPAVDGQRFSVEGLRAAIDDTVTLLGTPMGGLIKPLLFRDPTGETVQMAQALTPPSAPRTEQGVWVSRVEPRAVLLAFTRADGADLDGQADAAAWTRAEYARLLDRALGSAPGSAPGSAQARPTLELSGPGVMGVESRRVIKHESERLAMWGTAVMVALLLLSFGSLRALSVALLPVASGVLAGIAAVSLVFGQVHGFTLGFGTTLIGEAVDYAIYYLIQAGATGAGAVVGARRWLRGSWPAVRLGLFTSLAGFAAMAVSGFEGLSQLGVFSMAGLVAAAATTRWVLIHLAPGGATGQGVRPAMGRFMQTALGVWPRTRWPWAALTAAALVYTVVQPSAWRGNLASMGAVSQEAQALDASLRADLGAADGGVMIAVQAADEATVLERAEAAGRRLEALIDRGVLLGYESPARWLPSPATQRVRRAALPEADELQARLRLATQDGALSAAKLAPFVAEVQAQRELPALTHEALRSSPVAPLLNAQLQPGRRDGEGRLLPWTALLQLHLPPQGPDATEALRQALGDLPETRLIRISPELDDLYRHYLKEALWQALAGGALVLVLLAGWLRSARRLARVALPLVASVALVHAGLALAGVALGILHLVGFLLVVAVGSNYALFFDHLQHHGDAGSDRETWASLLLANLTTVLSFALLSTADMPALAAIGQVVAPGALLSLWLAAAWVGPRRS